MGSAPVRSFVAIELAPPARPVVENYLEGLRHSGAEVAWTRPESLHLTLKFLGNVEPQRLEALSLKLSAVAAVHPPFVLTVAGVGAFPTLARPRVLWVGVQAPDLAALAAAVDRACATTGLPLETRPFHAHLTLGRVRIGRHPARTRDAAAALWARCAADRDMQFGESPADALVLFRSQLGPGGARYQPLARIAFGCC